MTMAKMPKMKAPMPSMGIQGAPTVHTAPKSQKAVPILPKRGPRGEGVVPLAAGGKGKKAY